MSKENKKTYYVSISFACNDEHGNDTGTFTACHIGEEVLELDHQYWNHKTPKLSIKINKVTEEGGFGCSKVKGFVKISRKTFPILGYKAHWGNIIWDCVIVTHETAMEIIEYLRLLDLFSVEAASTEMWEAFDSKEPIAWTESLINELKEDGYQRP